MDIGLLKVKITFQKQTVTVDSIGNTKNVWTNIYTCHATVSGESGKEQFVAESTEERSSIAFTVRFCSAVSGIASTTHHILFNGEVYNILGIDHMSYKNKAVKFLCQKERSS